MTVWRVEVGREITSAEKSALRRAGIVPLSGRRLPGLVVDTVLVRGDTEEQVRSAVETALPGAIVREVKNPPVTVSILLSAEDVDVFREAATTDERLVGPIVVDELDIREIGVRLPGPMPVDDALAEAYAIYREVMARAGFDPDPTPGMYLSDSSHSFPADGTASFSTAPKSWPRAATTTSL